MALATIKPRKSTRLTGSGGGSSGGKAFYESRQWKFWLLCAQNAKYALALGALLISEILALGVSDYGSIR